MPKAMTIATLFAAVLGAAGPARADDECWVPMEDWQPRAAVAKLAADNGWVLRRIKIDEGCYEVVAKDANGAALEVIVTPATLEILAIHHEDDDRETGHGGSSGPARGGDD